MIKLLTLTSLLILGFNLNKADARRGFIPIGSIEKIEKVAELPDTDSFKTPDGKYVDIGSKFTVFTILWIPIYTEVEPELVGYSGGNNYYEIPKAEMDIALSENKLDRKKLEKLSFWNAWGGKIIVGLFVLFIIWGNIPSRNKKNKEVVPQNL